jgi:hypothetical protein
MAVRRAVYDQRWHELNSMRCADGQKGGHVRRESRFHRGKDLSAFSKEDLKPAWGGDNQLARGCLPDVLKSVNGAALGVNDAAWIQRFRPCAVGKKSDAAFHDEKHFILVLVAVRRRAASGRSGSQDDDHGAIGLLATELYLCGIAISMESLAALRWNDDGAWRKRFGSDGGTGYNVHRG